MTAVERYESNTLAEKIEWARAMSTGTMLPRAYQNNPANLLFALEYADTLGIPRINALTSIHVVDGKPTASADLIASLVRKAGHKLRVVGDDTYAEAIIIRADDPDFEYKARWDEAKARKAGKWGSKGPWSLYPAAMLRSRAITEVARMAASDALYGVIYTAEELGETVDADGNVVHNVTTMPRRPQARQVRPVHAVEAAPAPEPQPAVIDLEPLRDQVKETWDAEVLRTIWREHDLNNASGEDAQKLSDAILAQFEEIKNREALAEAQAEPSHEAAVEAVTETLDAEIVEAS